MSNSYLLYAVYSNWSVQFIGQERCVVSILETTSLVSAAGSGSLKFAKRIPPKTGLKRCILEVFRRSRKKFEKNPNQVLCVMPISHILFVSSLISQFRYLISCGLIERAGLWNLILSGKQLIRVDCPKSSFTNGERIYSCLLYTSPSPRDRTRSRMPSSA